jgi:phospholipase C
VFDHSSLIRFLEVWTGVHEPNISAWRRQLCGDLVAAFDFSTPDYSIPNLPSVAPVNCSSNVVPTVPTPQTLPIQESGIRPARPLPYQPNANYLIDCNAGLIHIAMTNSGSASVHFAVYPNAFRSDGPWDFDVTPSNTITSAFNILTPGAGHYDFTCYGPNGFRRRFAGSTNTNCNQPDLTSIVDTVQGGITLVMRNPTTAPVTFTITNGYSAGGFSTHNVSAGSIATNTFQAVANNGGWYDFTVTIDSDTNFLQQLSGHIETQPLQLRAFLNSGNLFLMYPTWATGYSLETCSNLASSTWTTILGSSQTNSGDFTIVTLPLTSNAAYFRLRK